MNKLALSALMVGGLLQATGCIITTDGDNEGGLLEVTWPVAACNDTSGTDLSAVVYTLNTATDQMNMDAYTCSEGTTATSQPLLLPLGTYQVWLEIQLADLSRRHATSGSETISFAVDGDSVLVSTDPVANEQGNFETEWTLADPSGNALTCAEAGVSSGRFITTLANTTVGDSFIYDCDQFAGTGDPLDAGLYTVVVEILDSADLVVDNFEAFEETIIGNFKIHLGIFDFTIP